MILCALLFQWHTLAFAEIDNPYLAELVEKSRQLHLADRPEWHKLVEYVPNLIAPGVHGLVDSPKFYNAPDGKDNPRSELEATLASFYSDIEESNEQQNPQCLFVARYAWLNEQLDFDPERLPRQICTRYQNWIKALNPAGLTLIFASAYLNSPSSMYGHTLLRVDAKDQNEQTRLLAYAINFAANADEANGVAFAVNGLFGGYPGAFSILPYYAKVREYSDLENRDIWEYQLNLTPEELERVLMSAWELGSIYYQYYFFDENCAYHLLGLLQTARPELNFADQFRWWTIPSDTVRAITSQPGMVSKTVFRPAKATIIARKLSTMSEQERRLTKDLSTRHISATDPALDTLPENRTAAVIETAQDYLSYLRATGNIEAPDPGGLAHELITARSRLNVTTQSPKIPMPEVHPDQGHGSSRITVGGGRKDGDNFQQIEGRGTYHDIMDTDGGYARGAQIEFFSLRLRHYESGRTQAEKFTPINILSLTPRDDFFHPMSWKIETGWERVRTPGNANLPVFALKGGAGGAWSNEHNTALWYALLDGSARIKSDLAKGYALGSGATLGGMIDPVPRWRVHGYLKGLRYFSGQRDTPWTIALEQRISLGTNLALRIDLTHIREIEKTYNSGSASMMFYF